MHNGHVTNFIARASDYNIYVRLPRRSDYLIVHGYTGAVDMVDEKVVSFLKDRSALSEENTPANPHPAPETINALRARGYLTAMTPREERELVACLSQQFHDASCRRSSFVFFVTYNCDFNCPYCFQRDIRGSDSWRPTASMSKDMVDNAYRAMTEINPERSLHDNRIMLAGGEPLLPENRGIISYIIEKGVALGYGFGAITNGYSLDHFADLLGPGVIGSLQVTLDGGRERHDTLRRRRDGIPTFDRIVQNVDMALASGAAVNVRINVSGNIREDLVRLDREFENFGWTGTGRFSAYIANVRCRPDQQYAFSSGRLCEGAAEATRGAEPVDTAKDIRHIDGFDPELRCRIRKVLTGGTVLPFRVDFCGATNGMIIFEPFGEIFGCLESVGMCGQGIGTYGERTYVNREKVEGYWRRSLRDSGCFECRYLFICGRGCPVSLIVHDSSGRPESCRDFPARFKRMVIDEFEGRANR